MDINKLAAFGGVKKRYNRKLTSPMPEDETFCERWARLLHREIPIKP